MKQSILALPALLRPALLLALASTHTFSVNDDLLAFPQYDVRFSDDWISQSQAQSQLQSNAELHEVQAEREDGNSQIGHYQPSQRRRGGSDGSGKEEEEEFEYEWMVLDGQRYLCSIPQVKQSEEQKGGNDTLSKLEKEKELARATDRGWELLSGMQGNCVYFISGWWSYKFCYNDGVRQFHQLPPARGVPPFPPVEDPGVEGFTLGMYEKGAGESEKKAAKAQAEHAGSNVNIGEHATKNAKTPALGELVQRGDSRYLVQRLEGGTKCDLTGKDRRIEVQVRFPTTVPYFLVIADKSVQFHCNPQSADRISLIKEISTCAYLMVIQTPRLCSDIAFLPPQKDQPNTILCSPVLRENEVAQYEKDLRNLRSAEKEAEIWESDTDAAHVFLGTVPHKVVGNIALGAHEIVPVGVKLERSAIVGGGKEAYIDTVASSSGKVLSREDLKKLGLGDAKAVEELRKRLEEIAQGQEWKLDVIDTPRGREYRGIIGGEDEDEDEGQGNKETKDEVREENGKKDGAGKARKAGKGGRAEKGSEEEYYKEEL